MIFSTISKKEWIMQEIKSVHIGYSEQLGLQVTLSKVPGSDIIKPDGDRVYKILHKFKDPVILINQRKL